jgi:hypothetical protein
MRSWLLSPEVFYRLYGLFAGEASNFGMNKLDVCLFKAWQQSYGDRLHPD